MSDFESNKGTSTVRNIFNDYLASSISPTASTTQRPSDQTVVRELDKIKEDLAYLNNLIPSLEDEIATVTELVKSTKKQADQTKEEMKKREIKMIETLGVFFTLFTFITVNIQIFNRVNDIFTASVFSLFIFLLLSCFLIIFDVLLLDKSSDVELKKTKKERYRLLIGLGVSSIVCIIILGALESYGVSRINAMTKSQMEETLNSTIENKVKEYFLNDKLDTDRIIEKNKQDILNKLLFVNPSTNSGKISE